MVSERAPVAYFTQGIYMHPACARSASPGDCTPVHSEELPASAWCLVCLEQILPEPCVFCEIISGRRETEWILNRDYWKDVVAFVPLNPLVEGHCLIVPKRHVKDFAADPEVFASTARRAGELMRWTDRPMNIITSRGREATQSVFHLHLHLLPRAENDGLALPWYSGKSKRKPRPAP